MLTCSGSPLSELWTLLTRRKLRSFFTLFLSTTLEHSCTIQQIRTAPLLSWLLLNAGRWNRTSNCATAKRLVFHQCKRTTTTQCKVLSEVVSLALSILWRRIPVLDVQTSSVRTHSPHHRPVRQASWETWEAQMAVFSGVDRVWRLFKVQILLRLILALATHAQCLQLQQRRLRAHRYKTCNSISKVRKAMILLDRCIRLLQCSKTHTRNQIRASSRIWAVMDSPTRT